MKITSLLLLAAFLQVSAKGLGQQITLSRQNATLTELFSDIEKQSGYHFLFTYEVIEKEDKVSVRISNATLEQALDKIFYQKALSYTIVERTIIVKPKVVKGTDGGTTSPLAAPPPIDVTGRVVDSTGAPLAGASISIRGTKQGTTTDNNGYFTLKGVDENASLEISYQGFELYVIKAAPGLGNISLKAKENRLQDIVVEANTGYQKIKPNEVVGSYDIIDKKTLNEQTGPNILERLVGVGNGFLKNNGKTDAKGNIIPYTIRTLATINASASPLIILDKFPFEGSIENINPNDVESVTILKDASATSIYGARGGNGVIVITTKKGKFNQKTSVSFNSSIGITEKPDLYYLPKMTSAEYVDMEEFLFKQGFDFNGALNNSYGAITPAVAIFLKRKAGLMSSADSASQINALKNIDSRAQMNKYFYSNAVLQQHSINISGGSNTIAWSISAGYNKSLSTLSAKSDKVNVNLSNTYRPIKNLQIEFGVYYTNSLAQSGKSSPDNFGIRRAPHILFADENGSPLATPRRFRNSYTDTAGRGQLLSWKYYPLEDYKHDITRANTEQLIANVEIGYRFLKSFAFNVSYQFQKQSNETKRLSDIESFNTRDIINSYTNLNIPITNLSMRYPIPLGSILNVVKYGIQSHNFRAQLEGKRSIGNGEITGLAGLEIRSVDGLGANAYTYYGYNENPTLYGTVDFRTTYPEYISGSSSRIPGYPIITSKTFQRNVSIYSTIAYTLKKKYSVNISGRKDASNIFGLDANDKWNPLWSVGAGWDLLKEKFFRSKKFSALRLRATWGYSGNVDVSLSPIVILRFLAPASASTVSISGFPGAYVSTPNNQDLKWERVRQLNTAVDFSLSNNFLSGSLEYYIRWGIDLYGPSFFDYTGFPAQTITKNVSDVRGTGVDAKLNFNFSKRAFQWTTTLILNYAASKVTDYFGELAQSGYGIIGPNKGSILTPVIGKPLFAIAAYRWGGLDAAGNPQGYVNGHLSTNYRAIFDEAVAGLKSSNVIYKGSTVPVLFGSVQNYFAYKKITASINIGFSALYYYRKPTISYESLISNGISHSDFSKRWVNPGDETFTNVPSFVYPLPNLRDAFYQGAEIHVLRADHARINYVNIGYKIRKINLYLNVSNLGIIWRLNKSNLDPDSPASVPAAKTFTIGIRTNL